MVTKFAGALEGLVTSRAEPSASRAAHPAVGARNGALAVAIDVTVAGVAAMNAASSVAHDVAAPDRVAGDVALVADLRRAVVHVRTCVLTSRAARGVAGARVIARHRAIRAARRGAVRTVHAIDAAQIAAARIAIGVETVAREPAPGAVALLIARAAPAVAKRSVIGVTPRHNQQKDE